MLPNSQGLGPGGVYHWCHFQIWTGGEKYRQMKMMGVASPSTDRHTCGVKLGSRRGLMGVEEAHTFHVLKLAHFCLKPFGKSLWALNLEHDTGNCFPVRLFANLKGKSDIGYPRLSNFKKLGPRWAQDP